MTPLSGTAEVVPVVRGDPRGFVSRPALGGYLLREAGHGAS